MSSHWPRRQPVSRLDRGIFSSLKSKESSVRIVLLWRGDSHHSFLLRCISEHLHLIIRFILLSPGKRVGKWATIGCRCLSSAASWTSPTKDIFSCQPYQTSHSRKTANYGGNTTPVCFILLIMHFRIWNHITNPPQACERTRVGSWRMLL